MHRPISSSSVKLVPSNPEDCVDDPQSVGHWSVSKKQRTLAPNLTRKSHTKSRNGCHSCKARKVKCDELKPICTQCLSKQIKCTYATSPCDRLQRRSIRLPRILSSSPETVQFSINDLAFFHHFLTISFPHLPLGNDDVWTREIPQFAHKHVFLMHAILALGASHLNLVNANADYSKEALIHRGYAISGLNTCMAKISYIYGEADAMLATCYALTFQSSYMPDGLSDFIVFVRGCALTTKTILESDAPTAFNLSPKRHYDIIKPELEHLPALSQDHISRGISALSQIETYIGQESEREFYNALQKVLVGLQESSRTGYLEFIQVYQVWYDLDRNDLAVFLDQSNAVMQLLFGFFIGIHLLVAPLVAHERQFRTTVEDGQILLGLADWLDSLSRKIPAALQHHLTWSRHMIHIIIAEVRGEPYQASPVLLVGSRNDSQKSIPEGG